MGLKLDGIAFQTGMLDLIRIRREGYPVHLDFDSFVKSYKCLCKGVRLPANNPKQAVATILNFLKYSSQDWQVSNDCYLLTTVWLQI